MESWSEELHQQIDNNLHEAREKDLRFFRIDEFKRNISRIDQFSHSCPDCKKEMINISEAVKDITEAVSVPGKKRRQLDRLMSRLSRHIQKTHGFYPPYYYTYLISFLGIIAGSVLGYFLMQINPKVKLELFSLGFVICLLPTYFWGHIRDKKIRKEKKLM